MAREGAQEAVHEAIGEYLEEGQIVTRWALVAEVADRNGRFLMHRCGGGHDGTEPPLSWEVLGMLQASTDIAGQQTLTWTRDAGN